MLPPRTRVWCAQGTEQVLCESCYASGTRIDADGALVEPQVEPAAEHPEEISPEARALAETEAFLTGNHEWWQRAGTAGPSPAPTTDAPPDASVSSAPSPPPEVPEPQAEPATASEPPQRPLFGARALAARVRAGGVRPTPVPADGPPLVDRHLHGRVDTPPPIQGRTPLLHRGDPGPGPVGPALESARHLGIEVIHGRRSSPAAGTFEHLVIAATGVWVIDAVLEVSGPVERRDLGDWFTPDPQLYIAGTDRRTLVATLAGRVAEIRDRLDRVATTSVPVRGVLCVGDVPATWLDQPMYHGGISITDRRRLVDPMTDPVIIDPATREAVAVLLDKHLVDRRAAS